MTAKLEELLPAVGYRLTGRWVRFELYCDKPVHVAGRHVVNGCARKDTSGHAVVTLQAGMTGQAFLKTLLHELAHVKKHFDDLPTTDVTAYQALSFPIVREEYTPAIQQFMDSREETAEALADKWYRYALGCVADFRRNDPMGCTKS